MYGNTRRGKSPAMAPFAGLAVPERRPMSIDAMLDMERQEVLALLEDNPNANNKSSHIQSAQSPGTVHRSASPYAARSPVRSMLDIEEEPAQPTPPRQKVRSMLDLDTPTPMPTSPIRESSTNRSGSRTTPSSPISPGDTSSMSMFSSQPGQPIRNMTDIQLKDGGQLSPRLPTSRITLDPTAAYQFSKIYGANSGLPSAKKNASGGGSSRDTNTNTRRGSLGDALRNDLGSLSFPSERGRHASVSGVSGRLSDKSKSPVGRRGSKPPPTFSSKLSSSKGYLGDGRVVDLNSAYRRLSDANLISSGGSLAQLPMRKQSVSPGEGRLHKSYRGPNGEHLESSDEDEPDSSDDEDRGRAKAPRPLNAGVRGESRQSKSRSRSNPRPSHSLLAAAEEERNQIAAQQTPYQYHSLIPEPEIRATSSSGDTSKPSRHSVHPHTSFDHPDSTTASQIDSDEEQEVDDIKKAQKLHMNKTPIINHPEHHRSVRIIFRGEYHKIAQAAEEEHKHGRKYLVATDLSDESTHALEWAIGTVLRDGDTLIAIYCVDEETGIITGEGSQVPDDPKAMRDHAALINSVTNSQSALEPPSALEPHKRVSALGLRSPVGTPGTSPAPSSRGEMGKAAEERSRAVEAITEKVFRLLRKTQLQVRVVVEVLHCKNPKHLITEVIDVVEPTLVVIGSRGRSALKGVILGSFSNYLVTKSSVPVMVARKRLRKQSKYKSRAVRQVNNLSNPTARSLANAKVD